MSVSTPHPEYAAYAWSWGALRAAYAGEAAVKGARETRPELRGPHMHGTRYLPRPPGMVLDAQYALYRDRASWSDFSDVVVNGVIGAIFRKEPTVTVPTALEPHLDDITQGGVPLATFAEATARETLKMGRFGLLVDMPPSLPQDAPPGGPVLPPRPYWIPYVTEEILNWRTIQRQSRTVPSLVVLREAVGIPQGPWPSPDFFRVQPQTQYRVLRLDEFGRYEVSLWVEVPTSLALRPQLPQLVATWMPLRGGQPLDFIPFFPFGPHHLELPVQKSLLEGLVEVNYRYYRHSADYEQALFLTASPTPYVCSDLEKPAEELLIGSSVAWWIQTANSKVGMLGLDPAGLPAHQIALDTDKKDMAALGARLLERPADVTETRIAAANRSQGAESPMQALITQVSAGLTKALQVHAWWQGLTELVADPAIRLTLNKDLVAASMPAPMLQALMQAYLNKTMTFETWYHNLQQGELARPGVDADEERELIETRKEEEPLAVPVLPPGRPPPPPPAANGATRTAA